MKFEAARAASKTGRFEEVLSGELVEQSGELPLAACCTRGGWPLDIAISSLEVTADELDHMDVSFFVSFTETGAACCSGDNFEHQRFEEMLLVIDKSDWSGMIRQTPK